MNLIDRAHARHMGHHRLLADLQPKVPVLVAIQRLIESASLQHQLTVEQYGVNGHQIASSQARAIKGEIERLPCRPSHGIHQRNARVGSQDFGLCRYTAYQACNVVGQQPVVIV